MCDKSLSRLQQPLTTPYISCYPTQQRAASGWKKNLKLEGDSGQGGGWLGSKTLAVVEVEGRVIIKLTS